MQIYRKPRERRVRIEAEWFGLVNERMPWAFWCAVSHEVRRRRVTRRQTAKMKALVEEQRRLWGEKAGL
jgi:hypothetical protein